jgi:small GTP-binding protein
MQPPPAPNLADILTPPGVGAIAVLRLLGPKVPDFLSHCFSRPTIPNRCVHGDLRDHEEVIDDPIVVLAPGGQSADINLHGGTWVVQSALNLAQRHGFSVIDAKTAPLPEFTLDATDEFEREMLAYLPLATTQTALRVLLAQPAAWRRLTAEPISLADAQHILADQSLHWLLNPPRVAIVGIPNAGKSTLANQLFGQQRSITADLPGTTRDWIGESANLDGPAVTLVDTPGIRDSDDPIESQAIERAKIQVNAADAIILVLDATRLDDQPQRALMARFPNAIHVFNKSDAAPELNLNKSAIPTIATTGHGIDTLRAAIRRRFHCESIDADSPKCWTPRQRELLHAAESNI